MADSFIHEPQSCMPRPTPLNFVAFLPYALNQMQAPFTIRITQTVQEEYVSVSDTKYRRLGKSKSSTFQRSQSRILTLHGSETPTDESEGLVCIISDSASVLLTAVFDASDRLVELTFNKGSQMPRLLAQAIGFCVTYQPYLNKITARWMRLNGETIYEMAKFLSLSNITDVTLDDSWAPNRNYYMLLERAELKRLSLARCNVDDEACVRIAALLVYPQPAASCLLVLSLSSNKITDVGAAALSEALRSNRSLQYLNLSGNQISDTGATEILRSLMDFYLTYDELRAKRQRLVDYLKKKRDIFLKCVNELMTESKDRDSDELNRSGKRKPVVGRRRGYGTSKSSGGRGNYLGTVLYKAEIMTNKLVGTYVDPFSTEETECRGDNVYSLGNTALCYLNLAYNNLGYASLKLLVQVLEHQSSSQKPGSGLLRVIFDGNDLPVSCQEYSHLDDLLNKAVNYKLPKTARKPERAKTKVG